MSAEVFSSFWPKGMPQPHCSSHVTSIKKKKCLINLGFSKEKEKTTTTMLHVQNKAIKHIYPYNDAQLEKYKYLLNLW